MASLKELQKPIKEELQEFEKTFRASMKSSVPLIDKITYYIVQRKGKQVRPMFVFLCAKMVAPVKHKTHVAASMIELLHTGSLVHDDVVDDSHMRRGFFSINALWKNKIAVLVGDFFFSKGFLISLEHQHYDLLHIISIAIREMSEGELRQLEKSRKLNITEEVYYEIIRQKTASLMAAACSSGAASVTEDLEQVQLIKDFGYAAGMAFQIKDDLFDYGYQNIGKPTGIDIKEKKLTLPLIHTINKVDKATRNHIIHILKRKSDKKKYQQEVIQIVKDNGGMEYARDVMMKYKSDAVAILKKFEDNPSRQALLGLLDFIVDRKN